MRLHQYQQKILLTLLTINYSYKFHHNHGFYIGQHIELVARLCLFHYHVPLDSQVELAPHHSMGQYRK